MHVQSSCGGDGFLSEAGLFLVWRLLGTFDELETHSQLQPFNAIQPSLNQLKFLVIVMSPAPAHGRYRSTQPTVQLCAHVVLFPFHDKIASALKHSTHQDVCHCATVWASPQRIPVSKNSLAPGIESDCWRMSHCFFFFFFRAHVFAPSFRWPSKQNGSKERMAYKKHALPFVARKRYDSDTIRDDRSRKCHTIYFTFAPF